MVGLPTYRSNHVDDDMACIEDKPAWEALLDLFLPWWARDVKSNQLRLPVAAREVANVFDQDARSKEGEIGIALLARRREPVADPDQARVGLDPEF
jgi:hypothetical protein